MATSNDYTEAAERIFAEVWRDSWGARRSERHRAEWPELWAELDRLAELVDRDTPADGMTAPLF